MADGKVVIDALLNTDKFKKGASDVTSQLKAISTAAKTEGADLSKQLSTSFKSAGTTLTKGVTLPLLAIGGASVKTAATFEKSMSQVAATMGLTADEARRGEKGFADMQKAAQEMGAKTQFSASQSAEAMNYLVLAGYDAEKAIATLPTVLNLAAAGGMELATASDMVTDAMSALGLETDQASNFVDQMAVTSQKSNTSVEQLGQAILTVGGTAKILKGGTNELNAELGILADNGIKGAEGGTALRNMILSLSAPTDTAAKKMHELSLEVFDNQGNMRSLDDIFQDLNGTLGNMSDSERMDVLSTLFNKVDLKSANALLANSGDRFAELSGYISDCDGAAQNMADTMNDNLNGKLTQLSSATEGAGIAIGNALVPVIGFLVDGINWAVSAFNSLDPSIQTGIVVVGGFVAAIGPLLVIAGTLISAITTIGPAVATVGGAFLTFATGPLGVVIAVIGAVIGVFVALYNNCEEFRSFIDGLPEAIGGALATVMGKFEELESGVSSVFSAVSSVASGAVSFLQGLFTDPFGTLRSAVTGIISWVSSHFKLPEIKFPPIKLPHFSISGDFSINPPSMPTIGVDWYAKGGYMNNATLLGIRNGRAQVGGEDGGEGIVPLEGRHMYPLADAIAERMGDSDATAAIYLLMRELPRIIRNNSPSSLNIDGREAARIVRRYS